MYKKSWSILYSKLQYKMCQYFLDRQYYILNGISYEIDNEISELLVISRPRSGHHCYVFTDRVLHKRLYLYSSIHNGTTMGGQEVLFIFIRKSLYKNGQDLLGVLYNPISPLITKKTNKYFKSEYNPPPPVEWKFYRMPKKYFILCRNYTPKIGQNFFDT